MQYMHKTCTKHLSWANLNAFIVPCKALAGRYCETAQKCSQL